MLHALGGAHIRMLRTPIEARNQWLRQRLMAPEWGSLLVRSTQQEHPGDQPEEHTTIAEPVGHSTPLGRDDVPNLTEQLIDLVADVILNVIDAA